MVYIYEDRYVVAKRVGLILCLYYSPQAGAFFETLVFAEIIKFIRNYAKDWELFYWRTKEGEEIDFLLKTNSSIHAFEVKLSIHGVPSVSYPASFKKHFSPEKPLVVITYGGQKMKVSAGCMVLPVAELHDYLLGIE